MKCHSVQKQIPLFVGGDLEEPQAKRVSEHLEGCPSCREEARIYEESREAMRILAPSGMPEEFWKTYTKELRIKLRGSNYLPKRNESWSLAGFLLGLRGAPVTVPVALIALLLGLYLGSLLRPGASPSEPVNPHAGIEESAPAVEGTEAKPVNFPVRNLNPAIRTDYPIGRFNTRGGTNPFLRNRETFLEKKEKNREKKLQKF